MNDTIIKQNDVIKGSEAQAYVTIDGERYTLLNLKNFESSIDFTNASFNRLGAGMVGHKQGMAEGSWSATIFYGTSIFRKLLLEYKRTGYFPAIEIQTTNDDKTSSVGRQTVVHKDCLIDSAILSSIDTESEILEEDISGTFDDWEMPEVFINYEGM